MPSRRRDVDPWLCVLRQTSGPRVRAGTDRRNLVEADGTTWLCAIRSPAGDWGSSISRFAAVNDASHIIGLHRNFCLAGPPAGVANPNEGVPARDQRTRERQAFFETERGYFQIPSTKPQTIGYALDDSPAGLAAWIVEKFRSWCDCGGNIESQFTNDELLTNIMLYWVTQSGTSSARIYFENQRAPNQPRRVQVPTGCAVFPREISILPRRWVEQQYNLTRWTEMPRRSFRRPGGTGAPGGGYTGILPAAALAA